MKKSIFKIALGVLAVSAVAACNLDYEPIGSITYSPGDQLITSDEDLQGFEVGIMAYLRDRCYGLYDYTTDIQMDYFNAAADYGNNGGDLHRSDDSFTASSSDVESYWGNFYTAIKNYNVFLEGSTEIPAGIDTLLLYQARGEAYFARAYSYLCLARQFGKAYGTGSPTTDLCVPIVVIYDQSARPARNTVQEVYDQIKTDIDSAYYYIWDLCGIEGEVRAIRPTVDAVNALYARYYLDINDWTNAATYAKKVIDTGFYTLNSTATQFTNEWVNDNGTEPILQFYASSTEGVGYHSYYYGITNIAGKYYTSEYYIPTKDLVDSYTSNDLRKSAWFGTAHPDYPNQVIVSRHLGTYYNENANNPDYYVFSKYKGNSSLLTSGSYPSSGQARKLFLVSEMYLIAAEASYNSGQTTDAKKYLNELQSSRNATQTSGTLENIQKEWYKETVGQGLRMSCLKRWGLGFSGRPCQTGASNIIMTGANYEQKYLTADAYQFVWPIPTYERQANPNLEQNDGYSDTGE